MERVCAFAREEDDAVEHGYAAKGALADRIGAAAQRPTATAPKRMISDGSAGALIGTAPPVRGVSASVGRSPRLLDPMDPQDARRDRRAPASPRSAGAAISSADIAARALRDPPAPGAARKAGGRRPRDWRPFGDHLAGTMLGQLRLQEVDELAGGHRVQFDARRPLSRNSISRFRRSVDLQPGAQRIPAASKRHGFGREAEALDVGEPQAEVDDLEVLTGNGVEPITAIGLVQRARNAEAADVEVVQDVERDLEAGACLIDKLARRRDDSRLARHDRQIEAARRFELDPGAASKPSFSM